MTPSQYRCVHPVCEAVEHSPLGGDNGGRNHFVVMRCGVCRACFSVTCESLGSDICRALRSVHLKGHSPSGSAKRRRLYPGPPDGAVDVEFEEVVA